jgi:hypothetical protein
MTDPEEKAAEIATQFGMWPDGSFAEIIATALREARTAALEEAESAACLAPSQYPNGRLIDEDEVLSGFDAARDVIAARISALKGE